MEQHLYLKEIHDLCKENKYGSKEKNSPLIDLRKLKRSNAKINEKHQKETQEGKRHAYPDYANLDEGQEPMQYKKAFCHSKLAQYVFTNTNVQ